ncbi:MAG: hypothetical protein H6573_01205 [Lewinellaceae bacterium]|nr:hypothetical protein [Phaeodactylibacter sp.]MCB9346115.1 hypothetical protein [Lewinellaceae bacterium]
MANTRMASPPADKLSCEECSSFSMNVRTFGLSRICFRG